MRCWAGASCPLCHADCECSLLDDLTHVCHAVVDLVHSHSKERSLEWRIDPQIECMKAFCAFCIVFFRALSCAAVLANAGECDFLSANSLWTDEIIVARWI